MMNRDDRLYLNKQNSKGRTKRDAARALKFMSSSRSATLENFPLELFKKSISREVVGISPAFLAFSDFKK